MQVNDFPFFVQFPPFSHGAEEHGEPACIKKQGQLGFSCQLNNQRFGGKVFCQEKLSNVNM